MPRIRPRTAAAQPHSLDALKVRDVMWDRYKRWWRLSLGSLVLGIASAALALPNVGITSGPHVTAARPLLEVIAVVSASAFAYFETRRQYFRCPRCNGYFSRLSFWIGAKLWPEHKCFHCGLRLYERV